MVNLRNLTKKFEGHEVINIESLTISRGTCFGLVGNNGAGKTTLLRLLLDLIKPTTGEVQIDNQVVRNTENWKKNVGSYIDQHFLISYLMPAEYFSFVGDLHEYSETDINIFWKKFEPLFNGEITPTSKNLIRSLSKGNAKKVGIAAAFIGNPKLILLDEPFENLDPGSQIKLKQFIIQDRLENDRTYIISSHALQHVIDICQNVGVLHQGKIIKEIEVNENSLQELELHFNKV
jgi:ABC-2 type transport system ATP-binding protein